jgi:hypothetical protein
LHLLCLLFLRKVDWKIGSLQLLLRQNFGKTLTKLNKTQNPWKLSTFYFKPKSFRSSQAFTKKLIYWSFSFQVTTKKIVLPHGLRWLQQFNTKITISISALYYLLVIEACCIAADK